jgi:hypothetical protein
LITQPPLVVEGAASRRKQRVNDAIITTCGAERGSAASK